MKLVLVEKDSIWLMNTVLGSPAIRDMASRAPYRPLKLHPIGTLPHPSVFAYLALTIP